MRMGCMIEPFWAFANVQRNSEVADICVNFKLIMYTHKHAEYRKLCGKLRN